MDAEKRERLVARCGKLEPFNGGGVPRVLPLVSIDEFFDGAEGDAGILCNVPAAPTDDQVLELLRNIKARPNVSDVRILITQCEDDCWPFSDTLVVITTASPKDVETWFPEGMRADEQYTEIGSHIVHEPLTVPRGSHAVWLWFD